ncbi:putative exported 24-amino acid repeat protein [Arcticibacter svalbardensis MN12-7]|uniref:Putative exported 24-amino acid repeat protein n=1 Tax=Arcticibacter svalbardensis MN12-7 TaxID=1150600 RepID=R9GVV8_9SPHI|nr:exported 24-amino acid repeat protein [Arcticibacter svalbardensis]EOR95881.1 putative exported 24-amino acid repeat protein [Arcticibacter svalbardensis MN12-7]
MKFIAFLILLSLTACDQKKQSKGQSAVKVAPKVYILVTDTALHNQNGTWMYKGKKANGYIIEQNAEVITGKLPVVDGKENGIAYGWFETGEKRYERNFKNGNRDGVHKIWYKNGKLAALNFFIDDKFEGEQKGYFKSGNLWQSLQYANGYEEGKQKTWNDSGRVVNNFTVKNGKLYGVIGRYDCMSVMQK